VWREIRLWNDVLVGVTGDVLVCLDRRTGKEAWRYAAHGEPAAYAVGAGRVFCADAVLPDRRGTVTSPQGSLIALDIANGGRIWQQAMDLTAPKAGPLRLAYAETRDVLVAVYGATTAYRGTDGAHLWGPTAIEGTSEPMLHRDRLITQNGEMYDLRSGRRRPGQLWRGKPNTNWDAGGVRGCNRAIASEHLALIRDGHASYFDLANGRQTFFTGVRAGCTNSLIPAGGILNAPNFSHGCSCNYAVFASLALMHMPEGEGEDRSRR
jgi:outer membrane protein assembly factor BamB